MHDLAHTLISGIVMVAFVATGFAWLIVIAGVQP